MENPFQKYRDQFNIDAFWKKLSRFAKQAGQKVIYSALLLFYAYRRPETPYWARHIILGTLGYFLAPIDAIPDLTPIIGYTDDAGVLSFGLVTVACYINDNVRNKAKEKLRLWLGDYNEETIESVDQQL